MARSLRHKPKAPTDNLLACQPKPWRRLVEVAGIEAASGFFGKIIFLLFFK